MIEVSGLSKRFASRLAVDAISFSVAEGEVVGFLGPNGAGKSTTLRMITGFLAPSGGSVKVGGIDVDGDPIGARRLIGYMPEGVPLYPEMRVAEYLRYRAALKGVPRRGIGDAVERSLNDAAVDDAADRIIGQLSKGYRQRVGLADALVADPPLLILDEPSSGLDPNQIRQVRELLRGFAGKKTIFVSTHILPEVEAICERVVIIHQGKKVGEGAPHELRQHFGGRHLVRIVGRGSVEAFRQALSAVERVREVLELRPEEDELVRGTLEVDPEAESSEDVFAAVAAAGLKLRELHLEEASLEAVFGELTTSEEAPDDDDEDADDEAADDEDADDEDADDEDADDEDADDEAADDEAADDEDADDEDADDEDAKASVEEPA